MDNSGSAVALEWSTPQSALYATAAGGTALGLAAIFTARDPAGMLLLGLAAAGLIFLSVARLMRRPRLAVRPATDGNAARIEVRGILHTHTYGPADITKAALLSFRRWGRTNNSLEVDLSDGRLLIFGRWDLGTHPQDVLDVLRVHGLAGPR